VRGRDLAGVRDKLADLPPSGIANLISDLPPDDPATSSTLFVATLVDVTGRVIYFGVGMLILRGTLL
jgi:hypothetical protein